MTKLRERFGGGGERLDLLVGHLGQAGAERGAGLGGLAAAFLPRSFVRGAQGITLVLVRHHAPAFKTYLAEPTTRRHSAAAAALLALAKREA